MIQLDSTICWKRQQQSARSTAAAVAECARLAEAVQSSTASSAHNHQPLTMQQLNNNGSVTRRQDDHTLYTDASPHYHYHCQHTHTHTFNGPLSGTNQVSRYQKGKTNLDFTEARDSEWQWHQLGHKSAPRSILITMPAPLHSVFLQAGCPS